MSSRVVKSHGRARSRRRRRRRAHAAANRPSLYRLRRDQRAARPAFASAVGPGQKVLEPFSDRSRRRRAGTPSRCALWSIISGRLPLRRHHRRHPCQLRFEHDDAERLAQFRPARTAVHAGAASSASARLRDSRENSPRRRGPAPARSRSAARWPRYSGASQPSMRADDVERRVHAAGAQRSRSRRAADRDPSPG